MMTRRAVMATGLAMAARPSFGNTGFYVPGEETPHQTTFMQWPNSKQVYSDRYFRDMTQQTIADIANMIVNFEQVVLLADISQHAKIRRLVSDDVILWDIATEDLWARDAGPLFAVDTAGNQRVVSLNFNGWGNKQVHKHDAQIAGKIANRLGLPLFNNGLVGEAGGVDQDGHGQLIAHESSWIINNRNQSSKAQIAAQLKEAFGVTKITWAAGVKGQDITDYHIDSLARFTGPNRAIIQLPDAPTEMWSRAMFDTHDAMVAAGIDVDVIPEPVTPRVTTDDFVASYANYYVCNNAVICAEFGDAETDAIAIDALARHYPGREIVALNVDPLGELGGGIHCATQQRPA